MGRGAAWIAGAVAIAAWPGLTVAVLAWIVGAALIVGGVVRFVAGLRGAADERLAALLLGVASFLTGLVALAWPDVTTFVIGVAFGARMVIFGISHLVEALRGAEASPADVERSSPRRWMRTIGAVAAAFVALALFGLSTRLNASTPEPDAFYDAPASVPAEPGQLIRAEAFTRGVPDDARAWRILYTTTRGDGREALSSGLVVVPGGESADPVPVITWAHGTTGQSASCAPSLLPEPFESGAMLVLDEVIDNGWALVATDYIGLGADPPHGYLVGADAGQAVLDAVRAARQLDGVRLSDTTVVWGHSQGGGSALWAGQLASSYAPDAGVIGVAALSAASDLPGFVANLEVMPGGTIFASYVLEGYAATYPDVRFADYVRGSARLVVHEMAARCLAERGILVSVLQSLLAGDTIWAQDPLSGRLGTRLAENVPLGAIDVPLFMGQGLADPIIPPDAQQAYVDQRCASGGILEYRTYPGFGHVDIVEPESPLIADLMAWTRARLAGEEPASTC